MLKIPKFRNIIVPFTLLALMAIGFFVIPENWLHFDRAAIERGQIWRFLTNIFTHSNLYHLLLNCASVALIWGIFHHELKIKLSIIVSVYTGIFVGICLYFFETIQIYVGFSGALYGIIVIACYIAAKQGDKWSLALMLIVIGRIFYQQMEGPPEELTELIESRVAIESHLYGIYSALVWIVVDQVIGFTKRSKTQEA